MNDKSFMANNVPNIDEITGYGVKSYAVVLDSPFGGTQLLFYFSFNTLKENSDRNVAFFDLLISEKII